MNTKTSFYLRSAQRRTFLPIVLLLFCGVFLSQCMATPSGAGNNAKSIRTLIVGGGSSHDFDRWYKQADAETLRKDGLATVRYTDNTDSIAYYLPDVDVLYLSNNQPIKDPEVRQAIMDFVDAGNGLVLGHAALWYNWQDWPEYNLQLVSGGTRGHDAYGSFNVNITNPRHPITKGVEQQFTLKDELYHYQADPAGLGVEVLATASAAGSDEVFPSVFTIKHKKGRIAGIALGHDAESHDLPAYQTLLRNAIKWAAKK